MESDALTARLLEYSKNRSRFGHGPEKPTRTGHCSNEDLGEAIGVRVWLKSKPSPLGEGTYTKYIHDIWWTGRGSEQCLGAAALVADRLLNTAVMVDEGEAHEVIVAVRNEFATLPEGYRLSIDIALLAFVRAVFYPFYTRTDWTDEDMDGETPSRALDFFCTGETAPVMNDNFDYWERDEQDE